MSPTGCRLRATAMLLFASTSSWLGCVTAPTQEVAAPLVDGDRAVDDETTHARDAVLEGEAVARAGVISASTLLVPEDATFTPPDAITAAERERDIEILLFAFEYGYGGRKYIDKRAFRHGLRALAALEAEAGLGTPKTLCDAIAEVLARLPDAHLSASLPGGRCGPALELPERVGENVAVGHPKPWLVEERFSGALRYGLVALTSLPSHQDEIWNGFLEAVEEVATDVPALVIDLRGNGGGDDTMGRRLAAMLLGGHPTSQASTVTSTTPATYALAANAPRLSIMQRRAVAATVPAYEQTQLDRCLDEFRLATRGGLDEESVFEGVKRDARDPDRGYGRPVYVLIDRGCASACESTLEWLEEYPQLETLGDSTAGFVHFGNMGYAMLPASRIVVQLATGFWRFHDGRWVEKIGYAPRIAVEPGHDALDAALARLRRAD